MINDLWDIAAIRTIADQRKWILHATETIDSTNTALLLRSSTEAIHRHWAITKLQLKGKGRRGKVWKTAFSHALLMSFGWTFNRPLHHVVKCISLVVGLSVIRALESFTPELRLKWPNDILLRGKKLAGILIETAEYTESSTTLVIGLGLNWYTPSQEELPESIGLDLSLIHI